MEEERDMEEKGTGKGRVKAFRGRVGRVGRGGTQQRNARTEKEREEKEESGEEKKEKERKEKGKEHSLERAICAESGDIRPSIAQKARAKEGLKEG